MADLVEAGRRLRDHRPEPTPPVSQIYRRSDSRRRRRHLRMGAAGGVLLAAAAGVILSVLPSNHPLRVVTGPAGDHAVPAAKGTASITFALERATVVAGTPLRGVATIDNNTGKPIHVPDPSCQAFLVVGLANATTTFQPNSDLMLCPAVDTIPVGVSHQPITVTTTYDACSQDPSQASSRFPACVGPARNVMPPLPPGTYHTVASVSRPFEVRNSLTVRLTANSP